MKLSDNELMILAAAVNHLADQTSKDRLRGMDVQDVYDDIMNLADRIYIERYPVRLEPTGSPFVAECPMCGDPVHADARLWGYTNDQPLCGECFEQYAPQLYAEALMSSVNGPSKSVTKDDAIDYMHRVGVKKDVIAAVMGVTRGYVSKLTKTRQAG